MLLLWPHVPSIGHHRSHKTYGVLWAAAPLRVMNAMSQLSLLPKNLGLAALLVLGVSGCGGTATVSGKVTYNGRPVTSGTVVFMDADGRPSPPAYIQADGTYSASNVPVGAVRVAIDNPPPPAVDMK